MHAEKKIFLAFMLNLGFALFEFLGGLVTGSVAILSDAVHDIGDAVGIGASWFLEKKSLHRPDETYTYGYGRYSVVGSAVTTLILLVGSVFVIGNALVRLFHPTPIHYDGMILFAVVGVCVNAGAAFFTRDGDSLNQRAVNLHMLEDVLGWVVVLIGAVIMRFTDISLIDPLLSIGVAAFILFHTIGNLKEILDIFLEKIPTGIDRAAIVEQLCALDGITDVHHIHLWSMDGQHNCATMHLVVEDYSSDLKRLARDVLRAQGIAHATLELELASEQCNEIQCCAAAATPHSTGHHHAHGGHHHAHGAHHHAH